MQVNKSSIILLLFAASAFAQAPQEAGVSIKTSAREVLVDVVVRDAHGKLVRKVGPKDIELYEDGVRRDIRSWRLVSGDEIRLEQVGARPTSAPAAVPVARRGLSPVQTLNLICLVFHDIGPEVRSQAFQAARTFLDNELRPNTVIGIFSLDDRGVHPKAGFTTNRPVLVQALQRAAAGQSSGVGTTQRVFMAMNLQNHLTINPPPPPAQAGGAGMADPSGAVAPINPDFAKAGAVMDASVATGDDASEIGSNPLGRSSPHEARVVAMRELTGFRWLIDQLSQMPFRKTVVLLSPGILRPADQDDTWKSMLQKANAAGISFYALEVNGVTPASPTLAAQAGAQKTAELSASQSRHDLTGNKMMDRSQQFDVSSFAVESSNTHASLKDLAEETGGFLITDFSKSMLERIMNDAEARYELTYSPAWETYDGRYHKIEVKPLRAGLMVEARPGYYSVPAAADGGPVSPQAVAGLRALNTKPLPRQFNYRAQALQFRSVEGAPLLTLALEVPLSNLTPAPALNKGQKLHASLLMLVKDSTGQIVEQFDADSPMEVPEAEIGSLKTSRMTYERPVTLAAGHYTIQTAVVDWESGKVAAGEFELDCARQNGPELSSITLVRRVDELKGAPAGDDPLVYQGKRIVPSLSTDLDAGASPSLFFRVYPDKSNSTKPAVRAQFFLNGRLLADQQSELPPIDDSGSIPVLLQAPGRPGESEMRLKVIQGSATSGQEIRYTVAAK